MQFFLRHLVRFVDTFFCLIKQFGLKFNFGVFKSQRKLLRFGCIFKAILIFDLHPKAMHCNYWQPSIFRVYSIYFFLSFVLHVKKFLLLWIIITLVLDVPKAIIFSKINTFSLIQVFLSRWKHVKLALLYSLNPKIWQQKIFPSAK